MLTKLTETLNKISTLATLIKEQATTVKAAFDHDVNVVKDYINDTLIPDIELKFETKDGITNSRKLSETGNFTGTWNGHEMVETDPGIQVIVNKHTAQLDEVTYLVSSFKQASDTDDTESINRALAHVHALGSGKVRIPYRTLKYTISAPLLMYSDTTLEVDTYANIFLANNSNCVMIWNANKTTQASLTRIDKNITVIGGIWDCNGANQTRWSSGEEILNVGFFFGGVDNITFKPTKIINAKVYGCLFGNVKRLLVEDMETDLDMQDTANNDGIHVLGPSEDITIRHCKLRSQDNCLAITTNDADHGVYTTFGIVEGVNIDDVFINNYDGGQGMLLLSGTYKLKNVTIGNIKGKAAYLMNMSTFETGPGDYDDITMENCSLERNGISEYSQFIMFTGKFGTVNLKNIVATGNEDSINGTKLICAFATEATPVTSIDKLNIIDMDVSNIGSTGFEGSITDIVYLDTGVTVNNLLINHIVSKNNIHNCNPLRLVSCAVTNLLMLNINVDNAVNGEVVNTSSTITNKICNNIIIDDIKKSDSQEEWIVPSLLNSWANLGEPYTPIGFYKDALGVVRLRGGIQSGTAGTYAFVLPDGYRPFRTSHYICMSSGGVLGDIIIDGAGNVNIAIVNSWIFLDQISFRAA